MADELKPKDPSPTPQVFADKPELFDAIEGLFDMCDAIADNLTIADLQTGLKFAIGEGHDCMMIQLAMVTTALNEVIAENKEAS